MVTMTTASNASSGTSSHDTFSHDTSSPDSRRRSLLLLPVGVLALFGATACNSSLDISFGDGLDGSGIAETTEYTFDEFDEVEVHSSFEATITVAPGPPTVSVTVDDNFVEHLDVELDGDRLEVGFERGGYDPEVTPTATITVPDLSYLSVDGAATVDVDGIDHAGVFNLDVNGASEAFVDGAFATIEIEADGASSLSLTGSAGDIELEADGASFVDLTDLDAISVDVDLSGASSADLGTVDQVDGELSGASSLLADRDTDVSVATSGASSIDLR